MKQESQPPNIIHAVSGFMGKPFIKGMMCRTKSRLSPSRYSGAVLLGVDGVAVKGHGIADEEAIYYGILRTADYVKKQRK